MLQLVFLYKLGASAKDVIRRMKQKMKAIAEDKASANRPKTLTMTKHFIERYHERVMYRDLPPERHWETLEITIFRDIDRRLLGRQKVALEVFRGADIVQFPFSDCYLLIVRRNTLITVLNWTQS